MLTYLLYFITTIYILHPNKTVQRMKLVISNSIYGMDCVSAFVS